MTPEEWKAVRARQEAHRTLLPRLEAGDELHQEAAAEIRRLRAEVQQAHRDAQAEARDAYSAGQQDAAERAAERDGW